MIRISIAYVYTTTDFSIPNSLRVSFVFATLLSYTNFWKIIKLKQLLSCITSLKATTHICEKCTLINYDNSVYFAKNLSNLPFCFYTFGIAHGQESGRQLVTERHDAFQRYMYRIPLTYHIFITTH